MRDHVLTDPAGLLVGDWLVNRQVVVVGVEQLDGFWWVDTTGLALLVADSELLSIARP